jgi:hypothetical protein
MVFYIESEDRTAGPYLSKLDRIVEVLNALITVRSPPDEPEEMLRLFVELAELTGMDSCELRETQEILLTLTSDPTLKPADNYRLLTRLYELTGVDYRYLYMPPDPTAGEELPSAIRPAKELEREPPPIPKWLETQGTFRTRFPDVGPSLGCTGGKYYQMHKNEVPDVEAALCEIPSYLCSYSGPFEWTRWARPEIIAYLWKLALEISNLKGEFHEIPLISGYRPLGTDVPEGDPEPDTCGERDASDPDGHWNGRSVDLQTKEWRFLFKKPFGNYNASGRPSEKFTYIFEIDFVAYEVGLYRPMKIKDKCHWCTTDSYLHGAYPPWGVY